MTTKLPFQLVDSAASGSGTLASANGSGGVTFIAQSAVTAGNATKLATGRTISITGDLAYTSPSFDGSGNVTAAGTLASIVTAGTAGSASQVGVLTYNAKGQVTGNTNTSIQITESQVTNLVTDLAAKQGTITLTTTGTSGVATFVGNTLNIPNYATGSGTVTSVSIVPANGFAGTVATSTTTPAITLTTSVTGILKGNGTAIVAAIAGTDYGNMVTSTYDPATIAQQVIGTTATQTMTNKRITARTNTITSSTTPTPAGDSTDEFTVTALAAGATFAAPTGTPTEGQKLIIRIKDNATAQTLAWNAIYRAGTDVPLPTTTVLSKTMYLGFIYNATDTKWDLMAVTGNI